MDNKVDNNEKDNFQYNDEYCGECGCGVECEDELESEVDEGVIHLTLEDGTEIDALVLGFFEVEDKEYVALLPEEDEDVLVYEFIELEDDAFELKYIDDQEEFDAVSEAFHILFSDEEMEDDEMGEIDEDFIESDDYDELED